MRSDKSNSTHLYHRECLAVQMADLEELIVLSNLPNGLFERGG
jgi:hypothetical protein